MPKTGDFAVLLIGGGISVWRFAPSLKPKIGYKIGYIWGDHPLAIAPSTALMSTSQPRDFADPL